MKKLKKIKIAMLFLFVFCILTVTIIQFRKANFEQKQEKIEINMQEKIERSKKEEKSSSIFQDGEIGFIIIPSIDIKAPIREGTTPEILKYSVGHFEGTGLWNGNVALASHNGGSYAHYFSKINELKNGEEIIYITNMGERRYEITESKLIEETNVEILEDTGENIITLVTCVKGKRDKRLCIIGKEKK